MRSGTYFLLGLVVVNLIVLDFLWVKSLGVKSQVQEKKSEKIQQTSPKAEENKEDDASSSAKAKQGDSGIGGSTTIASPISTSVREFFVPLGSGSSMAEDWSDVPGLLATVDSASYGRIKTALFEASVRIPTGNQTVYVRLYNTTDKHPVWFSEVSHEGGESKLLISSPITLDVGSKTYQVQMKTSLKFNAILDQSRIHITTY